MHESAAERSLRVIDATCPLVTKVHNEAKRFARDGYDILLIGHAATRKWSASSVRRLRTCSWSTAWTRWTRCGCATRTRWCGCHRPRSAWTRRCRPWSSCGRGSPTCRIPSDDICYATQNRQTAVKAMAPECELVIVVGSRNSSNSNRLVEVALGAGARAAHLVDYADDIDPAWLTPETGQVQTIGVTSGASVPEILVRGVLERLAEYGYATVFPVATANETLVFALPREIRPSRR